MDWAGTLASFTGLTGAALGYGAKIVEDRRKLLAEKAMRDEDRQDRRLLRIRDEQRQVVCNLREAIGQIAQETSKIVVAQQTGVQRDAGKTICDIDLPDGATLGYAELHLNVLKLRTAVFDEKLCIICKDYQNLCIDTIRAKTLEESRERQKRSGLSMIAIMERSGELLRTMEG